MAATGYTPISLYYSSTATNAPTAGNLVNGELALNITDGKLYYKDNTGTVQVIAGKGGAGVAGGSNTQVQYNSSGSLAGSANMTFNGTSLFLANDAAIHGLTVGLGSGSQTYNTVFGNSAGGSNTTGNGNLFVGYQSGKSNTTGSGNSFVGGIYALGAGYSNTSGGQNTAIGADALASNTTASNNTAVGYQAGYSNTTSASNTLLGYQAGYSISTGNGGNVMIGQGAGQYSNSTTTGYNNIYIGTSSYGSAATNSGEIVIGTGAAGKGSSTSFITNACYQGNNSTLWSITSDQRLKKNIVDNTQGLSKILPIQVRNFEYRLPEEITEVDPKQAIDKQGVQLGAIAQELALVVPECVKQESTGIYTVDADPLIWYLVNAVKELKAEIDQLKGN